MLSEREMRQIIATKHYTQSLPSGESIFTQHRGVIAVFSRPANKNISRWLLDDDNLVWELSRLWAPDGHEPNLLTQALPKLIESFLWGLAHQGISLPKAIISFADPNAGHSGGIYRAASWIDLGNSEESRVYQTHDGKIIPRRAFHQGKKFLRKKEIEACGFIELHRPGKRRFAKPLNRWARKKIENHTARVKPLSSNAPA
jgi:hypothetical protein